MVDGDGPAADARAQFAAIDERLTPALTAAEREAIQADLRRRPIRSGRGVASSLSRNPASSPNSSARAVTACLRGAAVQLDERCKALGLATDDRKRHRAELPNE